MKRTQNLTPGCFALAACLTTASWAANINVPTPGHPTIQSAIDAAASGDTITVAAGTYNETLVINKHVDITGAGSADVGGTIITSPGPQVISLAASGVNAGDPLELNDLRIVPQANYGINVASGTVEYLSLDNVHVVGLGTAANENENGLKVSTTSSLRHVVVADCAFDGCDYGWYFAKHGDWGPGGSEVEDIVVTNTTFNNNDYKGLYVEKLSDATFDGCEVKGNGHANFWNATWNGGFDINLKGGEVYQNISILNSVFENNGLGYKEGAAIMIKGRDDGGTYGANPASLDGVVITGNTITGNERGVRFGEPGKGNASPTNVTMSGNTISGNVQTYAGNDGSPYGDVINETAVTVAGIPAGVAVFNGVPGGQTLHQMVAAASPGDTINLADGTYPLGGTTLTIDKSLSIIGESEAGVIIDASANGASWGIRPHADAITLQSFTLLPPISLPNNGGFAIHADFVTPGVPLDGLTIESITIENGHRTSFDVHGYDNVALTNLTARNNIRGNGIQVTGCTNVVFSGCTTSGNAWGGTAVYVSGPALMNRASSNVDIDLGSNSVSELTTVNVQDQHSLVSTGVNISGANYRVDNSYSGGTSAFHIYTNGTLAEAIAIGEAINARGDVSNTNSAVFDYSDSTWNVGGTLTIQGAVGAASSGDTIQVAAGTYFEAGQILIDKDLSIIGDDASTVTIKPDHATSGGSYDQSSGWFAVEPSVTLNLRDVTLDGRDLADQPQTIRMAIIARGTVVVEDCVIQNITHSTYEGRGVVVLGGASSAVRRCEFANIQRIGVHIRGNVFEATPSAAVEDCVFTGKGNGNWLDYGVEFGGGGSGTVSGCTFSACTGVAASDGSTSAAILATDFYGNGTNAVITGSSISGCTTGIYAGYAPGDATVVNATNNSITGCDYGISTVAGVTVTATPNWWGAADGPSGAGLGSGDSVPANVSFSPWWTDAAMTTLSEHVTGDITVGAGDPPYTAGVLTIGDGVTPTTFLVDGGTLIVDNLALAPGATLEVVGGVLQIGDSVFAGTFTFFNSMGSVHFNDDVSITGSAEGLILVTDVHVADTATITVSGTLVIDGSFIDCQTSGGSYTFDVESGAVFTMARSIMTDGELLLGADDSNVYDNRFIDSTIEVEAPTTGARVTHNLFDAPGILTDNGTGTTTTVDGWGNVTDVASLENLFTLDLDISALPNRTEDSDQTVYVQPTDALLAEINVSALQAKINAVEVMLGYSTGLFDASAIALETDWNVDLTSSEDDSDIVGKLDSAIGLSLTYADPDGSDADDTIGKVTLTGQGSEGETQFFHRVKLPTDTFVGETRFTTGGGSPSYLAPFTVNSGLIVLDGTAPVIDASSSNGTQVQASSASPVDVLDPDPASAPDYAFRNGNDIILTFTATDAGGSDLDLTDLANDFSLSATDGTTTLNTYTVNAVEAAGVVTYTVELEIPAGASTGTYDVTATVTDRSGNESAPTDLGEFSLGNELHVDVELQSFVGSVRDVTFVATDGGGAVLTSWTKTVTFTGATGSVSLENVPAGTAGLSAKTDWNLRSKLAVSFSGTGVGSASFTGADLLPGGDINGDNVVNTLDYSILRFHWGSSDPTADMDGSGGLINLNDYNLLRGNFYTAGDAE